MSDFTSHFLGKRLLDAEKHRTEWSYKNPFVLASLYYTEGMSTIDIAELFGCEQRTVRRYMNYYGLPRFTKRFSLLVKHHGMNGAKQLMNPEYYSVGNPFELKLGGK